MLTITTPIYHASRALGLGKPVTTNLWNYETPRSGETKLI